MKELMLISVGLGLPPEYQDTMGTSTRDATAQWLLCINVVLVLPSTK